MSAGTSTSGPMTAADGGERRPGIDAEYRDRHGYRQLEIVACRLINSHA